VSCMPRWGAPLRHMHTHAAPTAERAVCPGQALALELCTRGRGHSGGGACGGKARRRPWRGRLRADGPPAELAEAREEARAASGAPDDSAPPEATAADRRHADDASSLDGGAAADARAGSVPDAAWPGARASRPCPASCRWCWPEARIRRSGCRRTGRACVQCRLAALLAWGLAARQLCRSAVCLATALAWGLW